MPRKKKAPTIPNYPEFPDKWASKLPAGWWEIVESMSREEMESGIVTCEKEISSTEKDKGEDQKLQMLKDDYDLYRSGYDNVISCQKAKIKFLIHVMNERGYA